MSLIGNDLQRLITLSSAGDMARMAEYFVINRQTSEHNHATRQARYQKFTQLRGQLSGPHPSPLEKLVVERIVFTWFHVNTLEVILGKHEDLTPERVDQIERRRKHTQRQHLAAIKSLAVLRGSNFRHRLRCRSMWAPSRST